MSSIKRFMDGEESKRRAAVEFLIQKGFLERCEDHEECVFEGSMDLQEAYKIAAYEYARGQYKEFDSQREFTDHIKSAAEDNAADECPRCEKLRGD